MKNGFRHLLSVLAYCLMLILVTGNIQAQLVTNGSFESSNTGVVDTTAVKGWFIQKGTGSAVFEIVSDTVEQGNRALKVTVNALGTYSYDIQAVADSLRVKPGGVYNYSIWAKASNPGAQIDLTLGHYVTFTEYKVIRPAILTTSWQQFTMQFTVNDNQTYIRGPISFGFAGNVGNAIYIDNLQIVDDSIVQAGKKPIIVEAESGNVGSNYSVLNDGNITYVTPKTNWTSLTNPGDSSRMITYQVPFADSGSYNLFARVRVGSGGYNDDSFFYGHGFGIKNDTSSTDWYMVNGLAGAGFTDPATYVDGPGSLGNSVWKWINITKNTFNSKGDSFFVSMDSLTKTFQVGSREDGLDIDKFAFGKTYLYFTVRNLDSVQAGSTIMQTTPVDSSLFWKGPALAAGQAKFLGNVPGEPPEKAFSNYWTQLTPGNAGKWGSIAGSTDTSKWNWSGLDAQYNYAITNHLIFKDHNLIWGAQQPSWISSLDSATQYNYIETWIRNVGQRYPKIDMVDVVNEPLIGHNPPDGGGSPARANYIKALGGGGTTGWDWVINSFKLARKYMPATTKLLINDYNIINNDQATISYVQIINLLQQQGLIDGIGVQAHRFEVGGGDTTTYKNNLTRLGATGLPVYISEFDLGNTDDTGTADDNFQLQQYKKIFPPLWRHPAVKGITLWGYTEGQMWLPTCYLVHINGTARPALLWLAQFVKDNPTGVEITNSGVPSAYQLEQNYPNPFNPFTTIRYSVPQNGYISLKAYNLLGQEVVTLFAGTQKAGNYSAIFDGTRLSSGVYFYRLQADKFVETKKLLLLK
jgi:endo-1,4-beta-xylanase